MSDRKDETDYIVQVLLKLKVVLHHEKICLTNAESEQAEYRGPLYPLGRSLSDRRHGHASHIGASARILIVLPIAMKTKNLEWTFNGFNHKLDKLEPLIRERALEIADELMYTGGFTQERAVEEGIELTEELYYDLEE